MQSKSGKYIEIPFYVLFTITKIFLDTKRIPTYTPISFVKVNISVPMWLIRLCLTSTGEDSVKLKFMAAQRTSMWCWDESLVSAPDIMVYEIGFIWMRF